MSCQLQSGNVDINHVTSKTECFVEQQTSNGSDNNFPEFYTNMRTK